jgi:hypothetical protein
LAFAADHAAADARFERVPLTPTYQRECAACHVAYPPGLLPAASWQRLIASLSRHYGVDASLDAATSKELSDWLGAHAATSRRTAAAPAQDRITQSAWFQREHDEVAASTWKLQAVKSPANCAACHPQADQWDFNEHSVRIPR